MTEDFGTVLRRTRMSAGVSLGELARRVNYSKSQLSKIENGLKRPNGMLAKLCDTVLATDGALAALLSRPPAPAVIVDRPDDGGTWTVTLEADGEVGFRRQDRDRSPAGAASRRRTTPSVDEGATAVLRASFDQLRRLGTMCSPTVVLGPAIANTHTLRTLAADATGSTRARLLVLASRSAEFSGWMAQEAGDDRAALWWTGAAVSYADAAGDRTMARYALVRRAEIAMYQHDALSTVDFARRAQSEPEDDPRVLGLAARCEAQGHALAGDQHAYRTTLDRAAGLLADAEAAEATTPVLGSASVPNQLALAAGWSLYDLGRPGEAAAVLALEVGRIPPAARRARARFGVRRALAHAQHGDLDQACEVAREALVDVAHVDSATVRVDLRELARTLSRWHGHPAVQELLPDVMTALNTGTSR